MASADLASHGRGGAGNIDFDDTKYADGEVTRVGAEGSHHDGAYSAGRGGVFFSLSLCLSHSSVFTFLGLSAPPPPLAPYRGSSSCHPPLSLPAPSRSR